MPFILFGGMFTNSNTYPNWISWFQYISPIRYSLEALVTNEFANHEVPAGRFSLLEYLHFDLEIWRCLLILAALIVFYRALSMFFLKILITRFQ